MKITKLTMMKVLRYQNVQHVFKVILICNFIPLHEIFKKEPNFKNKIKKEPK